jgi:hypothetical protein
MNSDIVELVDNLKKEENTGYNKHQKEVLIPVINRHQLIES